MDKDFEAVILSACRTPIGAFGGAFKDLTAVDLGAIVLREALARSGAEPSDIGDVVMGCVLQAGAGMNVARQAALKAGLPIEVPGETINRVCGSGMQAVVHAVEAIRIGYVDTVLAGGTAAADAKQFSLMARPGHPQYSIGENKYLAEHASTLSYDVSITLNNDDSWSYDETTMLKMDEFPEPFAHTDRNTLRRVG